MLAKRKAFRIARIVERITKSTLENKMKEVKEKTKLLRQIVGDELRVQEDGLLYSVLVAFEDNKRKKMLLVRRGIKYSLESGDKDLESFLKKELKGLQATAKGKRLSKK